MINRFITKKNHCFYLFGCGMKQNTRKDMAMKNAFTRFLAILLALCLATGALTSVAAVGADSSPEKAPPAGYDPNVIDYSFEQLAGWGYSFALAGNEYRYQTFTATADTVYYMVDGKLDDGKAWVVPGGTESVTFQLASGEKISGVQVWIGDQVPESITLFVGDEQAAQVTELKQGFNLISFPETTADTIRLEITGAADIYEVEIFQVPEETTDPVDPTDPTDPTEPSEPTDPSEPSDPSNPTETTKPEDTKEPTDPEGPDQTGETFALAAVLQLLLLSASAVTILLVLQRRKHNTR